MGIHETFDCNMLHLLGQGSKDTRPIGIVESGTGPLVDPGMAKSISHDVTEITVGKGNRLLSGLDCLLGLFVHSVLQGLLKLEQCLSG